jgi:hypothetical protein
MDEPEQDLAVGAIRAVMARYNTCGDNGRLAELAALFTEDGVLETGNWRREGREAIVDGFSRRDGEALHPALTLMRHHLTTCDITLEGPRAATGRSYFLVITNIGLDRSGVYVDRLHKDEDDQWRFVHRTVRLDWISPHSLMPLQPTHHRGVDPFGLGDHASRS